MKKPFIVVGIIVILSIVVIYHEKRTREDTGITNQPHRVALSGTVDCLQPKDTSVPSTAECRLALKTVTGDYYALDFNLLSQGRPELRSGSRLTATGLVTPTEFLSSDQWQKYNMKGIFSITDSVQVETLSAFDWRNSTFTVDGQKVTLVQGTSEREAAPGSASKIITTYFGNTATGDLNFDGKEDFAFLVSQTTGGSGIFYYAVAAINTGSGYKTTNAFLIGDRIAPQTTEIQSDAGELRINFAKRKEGEPMTAQPSQGAVLLLKVTPQGVLEGLMK